MTGARQLPSADFPAPEEGFVLTHFIVAADVERSRDFYVGVLGGRVVLEGEPTIVELANGWVNIRVGDIHAAYEEWRARGAEFLTRPRTTAPRSAVTCATPTAI